NKTALVTGANSGIGYATAEGLAAKNAIVHMICRNEERGRAAQSQIIEATGCEPDNVQLHVVDCSSPSAINSYMPQLLDAIPKLDILVNNAFVMPSEYSKNDEGNELCLATMLGSSYLLTTLLLEAIGGGAGDRPAGCVINVSSGGMYTVKARPHNLNSRGFRYDPVVVYALAKRVQVHLTETMAAAAAARPAAGPGVKFLCMHPGWVDTPGLRASMPDFYEKEKGNLRTAAEGADTILWLAHQNGLAGGAAPLRSGGFYFDQRERRQHYRLARTALSRAQEAALWRGVQELC
ncbi:unnamed protein product, partial [Heterosigma akashiwo]